MKEVRSTIGKKYRTVPGDRLLSGTNLNRSKTTSIKVNLSIFHQFPRELNNRCFVTSESVKNSLFPFFYWKLLNLLNTNTKRGSLFPFFYWKLLNLLDTNTKRGSLLQADEEGAVSCQLKVSLYPHISLLADKADPLARVLFSQLHQPRNRRELKNQPQLIQYSHSLFWRKLIQTSFDFTHIVILEPPAWSCC